MKRITMDSVFSKNNIDKALKIITRKNAAPGLDNIQSTALPEYWQTHYLRILSDIKNDCYTPVPLRVFYKRKPGKDEKRQITIFSAIDQMIQQCIRFEIDRCYTHEFHPYSFGFIRGRNTKQAVNRCLQFINDGKEYIVDADIRKCFDSIKHRIVMRELSSTVQDDRIMRLIEKYIKPPMFIQGKIQYNRVGLLQGSCMSPVLANVVLNNLDWYLDRMRISFVRYADDILLFCSTNKDAEKSKWLLQNYLYDELSLQLNMEKTSILPADQVDYLGYSFCKYGTRYEVSISNCVKEKMRKRMEFNICRKASSEFDMLKRVGAFNRGWLEYYGNVHPDAIFYFINEMQDAQNALIIKQMNSDTFKKRDIIGRVLSSYGYVSLTEWYNELCERKNCYD